MERVVLGQKTVDAVFDHDLGDTFILVTSPGIRAVLDVQDAWDCEVLELAWRGPEARRELVERFRELDGRGRRFTALWIAEDEFEHYRPDELGRGRIAALSYFSGGFSPMSLQRCLDIVQGTDYANEARIEEGFLDYLDRAVRIRFRSQTYDTNAVFEHQRMEHWFSLHGSLAEGQQVVLPTGELSTLTNGSGEFSFEARFPMNGEIVLKGMPVVHRGSRDVSPDDTRIAFETLASMSRYPAIVSVVDGLIQSVRSPDQGENPFRTALEDLFRADERYRKIHEIGFGTNRLCGSLEATNFFPNERYPGVHFGLGLGGYTPFHHDLVCTDIEVLAEMETGELIDVHEALGLR